MNPSEEYRSGAWFFPLVFLVAAGLFTASIYTFSSLPQERFLAKGVSERTFPVRYNVRTGLPWPFPSSYEGIYTVRYNEAEGYARVMDEQGREVFRVIRNSPRDFNFSNGGVLRIGYFGGSGGEFIDVTLSLPSGGIITLFGGLIPRDVRSIDVFAKSNGSYVRVTVETPRVATINIVTVFGGRVAKLFSIEIQKDSTGKVTDVCIKTPAHPKGVCASGNRPLFCSLLCEALGIAQANGDAGAARQLQQLSNQFGCDCGGYKGPSGGVPPKGRSPSREF